MLLIQYTLSFTCKDLLFDSVCVCVCVCVELKGQGGMQNNKERVSKIRTPLEHTFQLLWDLRFSRPMKIYVEVFLVCDAV